MGFHEVPWNSMRFYDVLVNRSVPTEANRGLTSYTNKAHIIFDRPVVQFNAPVARVCARLEGWVTGVQVAPYNR
jgi:hypothetical protein